jgi:hypothetical protein
MGGERDDRDALAAVVLPGANRGVASKPSISGILTSIRTMSKRSAANAA